MSLLELAGNALSGGVLGAAGAAFSRWHEAKLELAKLELANKHELARIALEQDGAGLIATAPVDSATYSNQVSPAAPPSLVFVDTVRGLVRPVLTAMLLCTTIYCTTKLLNVATLNISPTEAQEFLRYLLESLVSCTGIALTWWFGTRPNRL